MKKAVSFILILCFFAVCMPLFASAEKLTGKCGDNLTYSLDTSTGVLTVSGTGAMYDYGDGSYGWDVYLPLSPWNGRDDILTVKLEEGVTTIGQFAFSGCDNIREVIYSSSLTYISTEAICSKWIEHFELPEGMTALESYFFHGWSNLKSIVLPSTLRECEPIGVVGCSKLESITIRGKNKSFKAVDGVLFSADMKKLVCYPPGKEADVYVVPESVVEIGKNAFHNANVKEVVLPDGLATIGDFAFAGSAIEKVVVPGTVIYIPWGTFDECASLKTVVLNDGITAIGEHAFYHCPSLTDVTFPETLETIGEQAFYFCRSLESAVLPDSLKKIGMGAFEKTGLVSIEIPKSVTRIYAATFRNCPSLRSVTAEGVVRVKNEAFVDCVSLEDVALGVPLDSVDVKVFAGCVNLKGVDIYAEPVEVPISRIFRDVADKAYYAEAVAWAYKAGITEGTGKEIFSPDKGCTRAQVVTFLWRAADCPEPESFENPFSDVRESDYFYTAVLWATERGITQGTGDGKFSPDSVCTRAQIVSFLYRKSDFTFELTRCDFLDVTRSDYFFQAVAWAAMEEITLGKSETVFAPNETCTRAQIITFLFRFIQGDSDN